MNLINLIRFKFTIENINDLDSFISKHGVNHDFKYVNKDKIINSANNRFTMIENNNEVLNIILYDNGQFNIQRAKKLLQYLNINLFVVEYIINQANQIDLISFTNQLFNENKIKDSRVYAKLGNAIENIKNIQNTDITNIVKCIYLIKDKSLEIKKLSHEIENNIYGYIHLIKAGIIDINHDKNDAELANLAETAYALNLNTEQFRVLLISTNTDITINDSFVF